jgi:hypothetical protein
MFVRLLNDRMKWEEHVTCMVKHIQNFGQKKEEKTTCKTKIDGRITLKCILQK